MILHKSPPLAVVSPPGELIGMETDRPPANLRAITVGDRLEGDFLVQARADKTTRAGKGFALLTLANATGTIDTAPLWEEQLPWIEGVARGALIAAVGEVDRYQGNEGGGKRQFRLTAPPRLLPRDQFHPEAFLPTIDVDPDKLWDRIDGFRAQLTTPRLRAAVDLFFADDDFRLRFARTPGATSGHHAQVGGLLLHVWEVTRVALTIAQTVRKANAELAIAGALLHDIGKVEAYAVSPEGFDFTPTGRLLGHVTLGALMFDRRLVQAALPLTPAERDELLHMILSHHGALEYGSPVLPMTLEAELVHWADEASAKSTDMIDEFANPELFPADHGGGLSHARSWRLKRHLWQRPAPWG
jgi:3'-5' exoribonuclease